MTQLEKIKQHLLKGNSLTPLEALGVFGCFRLAARIEELRKQGMTIDTEVRKDAAGKKYARYSACKAQLRVGGTVEILPTGERYGASVDVGACYKVRGFTDTRVDVWVKRARRDGGNYLQSVSIKAVRPVAA